MLCENSVYLLIVKHFVVRQMVSEEVDTNVAMLFCSWNSQNRSMQKKYLLLFIVIADIGNGCLSGLCGLDMIFWLLGNIRALISINEIEIDGDWLMEWSRCLEYRDVTPVTSAWHHVAWGVHLVRTFARGLMESRPQTNHAGESIQMFCCDLEKQNKDTPNARECQTIQFSGLRDTFAHEIRLSTTCKQVVGHWKNAECVYRLRLTKASAYRNVQCEIR